MDQYTYRYFIAGPVGVGDSVCDSEAQYQCARGDSDACCIDPSSIPASRFTPYTIGCFKGCTALDADCFTYSNSTGTTFDFTPSVVRGPTDIFTGSQASMIYS